MLNSLFVATGLPARALKTSLRLALPFAIAIAASPAFAQVSESGAPASPIPNGLPQVTETTGKWSLPTSPPPNVIELPGVTQADIDRVTAQPQRPKPNVSASQPAIATSPLQPVTAQNRYFQNRYVRRIPIYQGSTYQAPLTAATCSYSPSSTFSYQTFSDLNNRNLPLQGFPLRGYGDNTVIVTERTVTERTFALNSPGLDRNQVIVSGTRYPQRLGRSNRRTFARRGSNRFDRLADCEGIERY